MFPNEKFDFVFSTAVLLHLEKEDAVFYLLEVHRVLKAGGKLMFDVPNMLDSRVFEQFLEDYVKKPYARTPIRPRYYCPEEVKKIVNSIGFEITEIRIGQEIEAVAIKR